MHSRHSLTLPIRTTLHCAVPPSWYTVLRIEINKEGIKASIAQPLGYHSRYLIVLAAVADEK